MRKKKEIESNKEEKEEKEAKMGKLFYCWLLFLMFLISISKPYERYFNSIGLANKNVDSHNIESKHIFCAAEIFRVFWFYQNFKDLKRENLRL